MINRIKIQNFKSIASVEVNLAALTVFVGRSGTGKSNFVNSIKFLRDFLAWGERAVRSNDGWKYIFPAGSNNPPSFEVSFAVPGEEGEFEYSLVLGNSLDFGNNAVRVVSESLTLRNAVVFKVEDGKWTVKPKVSPLPHPTQSVLGKLAAVPEARIAFTALTNGIGCYEFGSDVGCTTIDAINKSLQVEMARNAGAHALSSATGLLDDASNYVSATSAILGNLSSLGLRKTLIASLRVINGSVAAIELDNVQSPKSITVTHQFPEQNLALELEQESDGFRRFFAHLLALYQQPSKLLLIFEAPETGIHPGALKLLADEFKMAPLKGRGQVVVTTHSPELLNHLDVSSLRVVTMKNHETMIGEVSEEQFDSVKEGLLTTGELLTVDYARPREPEAATS